MALAVCLLFDTRTEVGLRRLWERIEQAGVPSMTTHTHGRHVPHLSYAVLRSYDEIGPVREAVEKLPGNGQLTLHFDALGLFRRGRTWLVPATPSELARRQEAVVAALDSIGADLHKHYRPGVWVPHCTLAPRVRTEHLQAVARVVYDVLPLRATVTAAALVDSGTGQRWLLSRIP